MEVRGRLHTPAASPRPETPVLIKQEAGWAPEPVRTLGEYIKFELPGFEPRLLGRTARRPVTTPTELPGML